MHSPSDLPGHRFEDADTNEQGKSKREQNSPAIKREKTILCGRSHKHVLQKERYARKSRTVKFNFSGNKAEIDQRQQQLRVWQVADGSGNFMPVDFVSQFPDICVNSAGDQRQPLLPICPK
jgi:hypothetical protein